MGAVYPALRPDGCFAAVAFATRFLLDTPRRHYEELLESLRVTLREALERNRQEALEAAGDSF